MRSAFSKDLFRQIRATSHRFLAILAITAIGVAFFAGLRACEPDMRSAAETYFDDTSFMDLRLLSTLGFDEDDIEAIRQTEGVGSVMPAYAVDVLAELGERKLAIHALSLPNDGDTALNRPLVTNGRLPAEAGECLADPRFLELSGLSVGDEITVSSGTKDPLADALHRDSFRIVGTALSPLYLSSERGSSSVGSGKTDAYLLLPEEAFSFAAYTEVYATLRERSASRFDEAYEQTVDALEDSLKQTGEERSALRYARLLEEGREELADARREIAAGYRELEDAEQAISDAEAELATSRSDYERERSAFEKQIEDGRKQLEEGYRQYREQLAAYEASLLQYQQARAAASGLPLPELDATEAQLTAGRTQLDEAKAVLDTKQVELDSGAREGPVRFDEALQTLHEGEAELAEKQAEFLTERESALVELADAEQSVMEGEADLNALKAPEWHLLDAGTNIGFVSYKQDSERIGRLGLVLPALFFLVAVLVSMTTMTRLVDSDRSYIGTLKALGYSNGRIASRYLIYALSASVLGAVVGLAAGLQLFPRVAFDAYATMYTLPAVHILFPVGDSVLSLCIAAACAALPAWISCLRSLREAPAQLMRPAAPRMGKRTLAERITPLWRRLSFTHKITVRNLFRYKKRMLMTVIGVAGCTALMFTGYGMRDSITTIESKQFDVIQRSDLQITLTADPDDKALQSLAAMIAKSPIVSESAQALYAAVDASGDSVTREVTLTVPTDGTSVSVFAGLRERIGGTPITLTGDGAVVTEKLAGILGVKTGSRLTLRNGDGKTVTVPVQGIAENYLGHAVYFSEEGYRNAFGEEPEANQVLLRFTESDEAVRKEFSAQLLREDAVSSVAFTADQRANLDVSIRSLRYVVLVLIASAAALVFVVLFSLTTVNLEERTRELATIKVLGFFDRELAAYVYREAGILTLLGTGLGLLLGVGLQRLIIAMMEVDMLMFSRDLLWPSFALSAGMTLGFAALVGVLMFRSIKRIDMVSSLKSIE